MKTRFWILALTLAFIATARAATNDLTGLLQKGLFEEEANRDLPAAIASYQSLANSFDKDRQLAATAIFRLGECYRKLGKTNEAVVQYQRVIKEFGDQETLVTLSRQNLTGLNVPPTALVNRSTGTALVEEEAASLQAQLDQLLQMPRSQLRIYVQQNFPNPVLTEAMTELVMAQQQLLKLKNDYTPDHPKYKTAQEMVDNLNRRIDEQVDGVLTGLNTKLDVAKAQVDLLRKYQNQAAGPAGGSGAAPEAVVTDEEQQEIRRIQLMIQNSPDLINAPNSDGMTPLLLAAVKGQLQVAKYLLDHGADVNGLSRNHGDVPLTMAAGNGHKAMVELLLARGADVNGKGLNPLYEAVEHGFTGVAEVLIASNANVNLRAGTVTGGRRPLHAAVHSGKTELIQLLIAHGADVNVADDHGRTALHWTVDYAEMQDELPAAKMLLAAKASVDPRDSQGYTPLYDAAGKGNAEMVSLLLDSGASVDATNNIRGTPLQIAVYNQHIAAAKVLLEHKADPNHSGVIIESVNNSWVNGQPVYFAMGSTNNPMLKLLLDSGASPNPSTPGQSQSPLFYAIDRNEVEAVGLLLDHGADPNLVEHGIPALHTVLRKGKNTRMIPLLLDKGADPNARDSEGMPALFLTQNPEITTWLIEHKADVNGRLKDGASAIMRGLWNTNYLKVLLQNGANVDLQETNGNTALHLAVYYGNLSATAVLLEGKANPNIQNSQGYTPLDLAEGGKKGANLYAMLNPGPGSGSSPARDMEEQIAQLLINAGGLANLPKRDRIEVRRASYSPSVIYKDKQGRNQMSLLEVIACKYYLLSPAMSGEWQSKNDSKRGIFRNSFPFPDFKNVVIYRRTENSTRQTAIKVDVEDILNSGDCSRDVRLQWGDVVEIPESDHPVDEQWDGLLETIANPLIKCVSRQVTIKIKGESSTLKLAPQLAATSSLGAYGLRQWNLTTAAFMLRSVLDNSKLIRVSSDLAHVKVTRPDPATGKSVEWIVDCTDSNQADLWLRDGDVIEVPEK